jgi:acyl transferase domain-containing protein/SAM-dependent methyltransferase
MSHRNLTGPQATFEPVAIIGMRGRFPGANDLDEYWDNLVNGVESIAVLTPEEMRAAGVADEITQLPGYVNASPVLSAVDKFDAEFFGFSARDAALTDPQHRLFLETTWEALEDAGYDPATHPGAIGVFAGCEMSTYLYQLFLSRDQLGYLDGMQLMVTNDKDHLCTQVSYRLDLRGPSIAVQTTCSTSLVAAALACESLQARRCDIALAGGVTVRVPQRGGYLYTPGSILSPDGHCRPFDAQAQGTIVGSGVGVVVLRRLEDALSDGDNVRAVILGAGLNNDGSDKAGYTAPSFRGQTAAIQAAQAMSGVSADTIGYVEAHGTGTILGDPIELSALTEAFRAHTTRRGFCGIGSVKSNFGHLSCAAGVAGLIKTVLVLERGAIPPTVHYSEPNPAIDFASGPFYVTTSLQAWERNGTPRRAGVSSFGVGGTNAHLVVEEAPERSAPQRLRPHHLLTLSARSPAALGTAATQLAAHLERHPELDVADVAFTLQVGRRQQPYRRFVVACDDASAAVAALREADASVGEAVRTRPVVFMFPGQGAQYPRMAAGLYHTEPVVRSAIDRCARILKPLVGGEDLRRLLFPGQRRLVQATETLKDTRWAQPALFTVEYALSQLLLSWGIAPAAMIGHSVGEFVAATLAGVFTLEDALTLIARRGSLISALPRGSMLAVMAPAKDLEPFVDDGVSVAAFNAPGLSVLSGPSARIERVEVALAERGIAARRLHTSHAFHSSMMDPILAEFEELVAKLPLTPPTSPFVSTLDGEWADGAVCKPGYWSAQLRSGVRFDAALRTILAPNSPVGKDPLLLEVGPGGTLVTFAAETARAVGQTPPRFTSLPGPGGERQDTEVILGALGGLWANGAEVDWRSFQRHEHRRRVSLPTYPFERSSYWIGPRPEASAADREPRDTTEWFRRPVWSEAPQLADAPATLTGRRVLVFDEGTGLGAAVATDIRELGGEPLLTRRSDRFECTGDGEFAIDPADQAGFDRLAAEVCATDAQLAGVVDCWSAAPPGGTDLEDAAVVTLLAPMRLARALSNQSTVRPLPMLLVARGARSVERSDALDPPRALGVGPARVLPQEHPGLRLAHIDVDDSAGVPGQLVAELASGAPEPTVALRRGKRFVEAYERVEIGSAEVPASLPERPVVMISGGMGHIGFNLAESLFDEIGARLVLLSHRPLADPSRWATQSKDPTLGVVMRDRLRRLARMQAERDELVVLAGDLNDAAQVRAIVDGAVARFGRVDVVVHGAGRVDPAAFASAADTGPGVVAAQFKPKLYGLLHLIDALRGREPSRWILHSSISSSLGGLGLAAYAAANAVLDAIAVAGGDGWLSIDWDAWDNAGEAGALGMPVPINPLEGRDAFLKLLGADCGPQALVVAGDFDARLDAWVRHAGTSTGGTAGVERHPRPNLSTPFVEPQTETEKAIAEIWGAQLGVAAVGVHDRFLDLGGHSLLAVQVASEIRDAFEIELPVLKLFQAPTVGQLATIVDDLRSTDRVVVEARPRQRKTSAGSPEAAPGAQRAPLLARDGPAVAAKAGYREFYDDVTRKLESSGVGDVSFFLNYGYVRLGDGNESTFEVPDGVFNPSSVMLVHELIGSVDLAGQRVLDVGCGRGGTVALLSERYGAEATGLDLSPEAVAFCRRVHGQKGLQFEVGDAEELPFEDQTFDVVTNIESSHTYPNLRAFIAEVRRVLVSGGWFLYTDLLPVQRWAEVRVLLGGFDLRQDRPITANVLASCDLVAATRVGAFGETSAAIDNFLAVPGSAVYEQMHSGAWEYRIIRAQRR